MKIDFNHWSIEVDVGATRAAYAATLKGDAEECVCSECRNFAAQRNTAYTPETIRLFESLGIDPLKEFNSSCWTTQRGKHLYCVSHCFVGSVRPDELRAAYEDWMKLRMHHFVNIEKSGDLSARLRLMGENIPSPEFSKHEREFLDIMGSSIILEPRNGTSRAFPSPTCTMTACLTLPWVIADPEPEP